MFDVTLDLTNVFIFWLVGFISGFLLGFISLLVLLKYAFNKTFSRKLYVLIITLSVAIGILFLLFFMYSNISRVWNNLVPNSLQFEDGYSIIDKRR